MSSGKGTVQIRRGSVCAHVCMYVYACFYIFNLSYLALRVWEFWHHSANDDYDDGVYLSVEVEKVGWGLNECSVRGCRERSAGPGREREWSERQTGKKGWIVLCVANERKERATCGMFTCQCKFLLWLMVSVCLCVSVTVWVSTMKYQAYPYYNLTIMSITY